MCNDNEASKNENFLVVSETCSYHSFRSVVPKNSRMERFSFFMFRIKDYFEEKNKEFALKRFYEIPVTFIQRVKVVHLNETSIKAVNHNFDCQWNKDVEDLFLQLGRRKKLFRTFSAYSRENKQKSFKVRCFSARHNSRKQIGKLFTHSNINSN